LATIARSWSAQKFAPGSGNKGNFARSLPGSDPLLAQDLARRHKLQISGAELAALLTPSLAMPIKPLETAVAIH